MRKINILYIYYNLWYKIRILNTVWNIWRAAGLASAWFIQIINTQIFKKKKMYFIFVYQSY